MPGGRWKEGLLFEGIEPVPCLKSAANCFPNAYALHGSQVFMFYLGLALLWGSAKSLPSLPVPGSIFRHLAER